MKVVEQFKRRILDLAIRGKLVPQDPNDEPASELLARIKAEKEKLIKAGKIKKGKSSAVGSDGAAYEKLSDDVPFELPNGWAWCKLNDVLRSLHTGLNPRQFFKLNTPDATNYYVTIRELKNNQVIFNNRTDRINNTALYLCNKRSNLEVGDILFGGTGSIGATAIVSAAPVNWNIKEGVYALKPDQKAILPHFLLYLLQAPTIKKLYMEQAVGATVLSVPMKEMNTLPIPLPPLAEQRQIVSRIEELFKIADRLGEAAGGLEAAARCLDKKILDLAIRGKLVPQDPSDEPASELLKRIAITSHRSPCKNHETPIEPPFKIPESWVWTRLGTICEFYLGKTPPRANKLYWAPPTVPWVTISDMTQYGRIVRTREGVSSYAIANGAIGKISPAGTLLMSFKLTIGKVSILDCDATHNEAIISILPCCNPSNIMRDYLFATLPCLVGNAETSPAIMGDTLNKKTLSNLLIPLPPLAEQKRIVSKVGELKSLLQALATS